MPVMPSHARPLLRLQKSLKKKGSWIMSMHGRLITSQDVSFFFLTIIYRSKELFEFLNQLQSKQTNHIIDVRGQGLMVAVEFSSPSYSTNDPVFDRSAPKNLSSRVTKRCIEKGMLLLTTSVYEVVRFIPPLNISQADMKKGCNIFAEALDEIVKEG